MYSIEVHAAVAILKTKWKIPPIIQELLRVYLKPELAFLMVLYLLQLLFVLVPMTLPHVSLLGFGIAEGDEALKTL